MDALPSLPLTYRPRNGRIVPYALAVAVLAICGFLALALPSGEDRFGLADRLGILGIGVAIAAVLGVLARPRATVDEHGVTVVNLIQSRTLDWAEIITVNLGRGDPWVLLDLADGETLAVMAIQANDGERAHRAASELRKLVAAHSRTERDD